MFSFCPGALLNDIDNSRMVYTTPEWWEQLIPSLSLLQVTPAFWVKEEPTGEGGGERVISTVQIPEESSEPTPAEWHAAKREKYQAPTQPPPGLPWALTAPRDMNPVAVGLLRDTILTVSSLHSSEHGGDPL